MDWLPVALSVLVSAAFGLLGVAHLRLRTTGRHLTAPLQQKNLLSRPLGLMAILGALGILAGIKFSLVDRIAAWLLAVVAAALFVVHIRARSTWSAIALVAAAFLLACFHLGFEG